MPLFRKIEKKEEIRKKKEEVANLPSLPAGTVPELAASLNDKDAKVRLAALNTLGKMGRAAKAALPAINKALDDPDKRVRVEAAYVLWLVDQQSKPVIAVLSEAVRGKDEGSRLAAIPLLGKVGTEVAEARGLLVELLAGQSTREAASGVLVAIGKKAVPELVKALEDPQVYTRLGVIQTLADIGPEAKDALERLAFKAKNDSSAAVRTAAMKALERIKQK